MGALTGSHLLSVFGFAADDVFIGGAEGIILHYDGKEWSKMDSGGRWTMKRMWGTAHDNLYGVCTDGKILHYDGSQWAAEDTESFPPMSGIWGLSADEIYACCRLGKIARYDGTRWKYMQSNSSTDVASIWGTKEGGMYAVGFDGLITDSMDMNLSKLWEMVKNRETWHTVHRVAKSWIQLSN